MLPSQSFFEEAAAAKVLLNNQLLEQSIDQDLTRARVSTFKHKSCFTGNPIQTMEDYVHRIGRTGRAGSTGQATSFYTDRDMFLVAHIRKAIADVESGNTVAFATGKVARKKEREAAAALRDATNGLSKLAPVGPTSISVEDKYRYMLAPTNVKGEGAADEAWDD